MTHGSNDTTHGSLFSGVGGFDLAAEWMGWQNLFHCEWNPFGQKVLNYYWPQAESFTDITKTDFTKYANRIDVLSGGFPCQPFSVAGEQKGTEDHRYLWPEMLRAIREVQPRWIVGENVRGLTNWNGGMVFDEVQADLEFAGYEVLPFLLPACAKDAPHRRDRIWFIAYSESANAERGRRCNDSEQQGNKEIRTGFRGELGCDGSNGTTSNSGIDVHAAELVNGGYRKTKTGGEGENEQQDERGKNGERLWTEPSTSSENATNTECIRQQGQGRSERQMYSETFGNREASWSNADGGWPTQSPVCFGDDGISTKLDINSISRKEWYEESLKSAGNAIVPQVALEIFKAIEAYNFLPEKFIK